MDDERLQLAIDIIDGLFNASALSRYQYERLGWSACDLAFRPEAKEVRLRARAIISQYNAEMRSFATSETAKTIAEKAKSMTPAEFRESLAKAGIIDRHGQLTEPYRRGGSDE